MADISLTASMRSNLLSLQNTQSLMDMTQERLSTGKKVNSAIDNPSSYYTSQSLTNRASDLSALLDSIGQGVQTLKAANEGIEAITAFTQQAKSVANSAHDIANNMKTKITSTRTLKAEQKVGAGTIFVDTRADKSTTTVEMTGINTKFTNGKTGTASFDLKLMVNGEEQSLTVSHTVAGDDKFTTADIQKALDDKFGKDAFTATLNNDSLKLVSNDGASIMVTGYSTVTLGGDAAGGPTGNALVQDTAIKSITLNEDSTVQDVVDQLNALTEQFDGANNKAIVAAELDPITGKLVIKASEAADEAGVSINITTNTPDSKVLQGVSGQIETRASDENAIEQRNKYVAQFNEILTQIDQVAKDSGYKGINLLQE